jgi:hypothetical protein
MPPQQHQGLLYAIDQRLRFRPHVDSPIEKLEGHRLQIAAPSRKTPQAY